MSPNPDLINPRTTMIHVTKHRRVQAVSYWYGANPPTDQDDWSDVVDDIFSTWMGWQVTVPHDATYVLYYNPTPNTYTTWAQYTIQGGQQADPVVNEWSGEDPTLLWWSPKLTGAHTKVSFYAKYTEPETGQTLTLEWDIADQQSPVARAPLLWKSNGDWSYDAKTDTYTGHVTFIGTAPAGTLKGLAYDMGVAAVPPALLTDNPGLPNPITNGTVINIRSLLAQLDSDLRANVVAATRAFIGASPLCGNGKFGTFSFGTTLGFKDYSAATLQAIFTGGNLPSGGKNITFGCYRSFELCWWEGLMTTIGANDYATLFGAPAFNSITKTNRKLPNNLGAGVKSGDWVIFANWPGCSDKDYTFENATCVSIANPVSGNSYLGWPVGEFTFSGPPGNANNWLQRMMAAWYPGDPGNPLPTAATFPGIYENKASFWDVIYLANRIFNLRNNGKQ